MSRKQGPRPAGMRPAANDAGHRCGAVQFATAVWEVAA